MVPRWKLRILPLLLILGISSSASAGIEVISSRTKSYPGGANSPPSRFVETKKRVTLGSTPKNQAMWLTDISFGYTAKSASEVEDVAVVQFLRGCLFHSEAKNGKTSKSLTIARTHFGRDVTFQHRDWEIDSDSNDPIYTSYKTDTQDFGRFALLRWNQNPNSLNRETSKYHGQTKSPHGTVFMTDMPGGGFLSRGSGLGDGGAQNASLEFNTCLFRTSDLPLTTTPRGAGVDLAKALWCVNWSHKYVWDFRSGKMTSPSQIDAVCEVR